MMHYRCLIYLFTVFCLIPTKANAQDLSPDNFSNEQLGSIYYAYPQPDAKQTDAPKGYEAFYISHYGRHGSRWITSDDRYSQVIDIFDTHELTDLGHDVKLRLHQVWDDAQGRSGDLTPLGERQHKAIAERMTNHYPSIFNNNPTISARSSTSVRCVMSMSAFCERLKELNSSLQISKEANQRYMSYIAYTSPEAQEFSSPKAEWLKDFRLFENKQIKPQRLLSSLFKHPEEIREPHELMMGLYWIASDMQNVELKLSFYDIFEKQELFDIWQCINYRMYVNNGNCPLNKGIMPQSASSLLKNIIETADTAIQNGTPSVTLRFGHDTYLIRLLALMQIEGCANQESNPYQYYQAWQDFRVSPMAANLQIIFFKNKKGDVIIKLLHNEREVKLPINSTSTPYYKWDDVKALYARLY